jgi:uncharacterized membrane protein
VNLADLLRDVSFAWPGAFYLFAIPAAVLLWSAASLRDWRKMFAPLMRAIALALFVLALAGPNKIIKSEGATRPAVVDASVSITPAMRAWSSALIRDQLKLRAGDPAILFASSTVPETVGDALAALASPDGCKTCDPAATNLEAALEALAQDAQARGGPAVLVTDGWQNRGDAAHAAAALLAAGIRLYIFTPPGAKSVPNVAMRGLALPSALSRAAPFALGVTMENLNRDAVAGTILIYRNGSLIDQRKVTLNPGEERFDFPVHTENAGLDSYKAAFKADDPKIDAYLEDDSLQGWVGIGARQKILILTDTQKDASYLETVVRRMGLEPVVVPVTNGQWNGSLAGYETVVLNNLPRERLAPAAQTALVNYVERGGSLAMVGGDESFGLGGYQQSPIAAVMPVVMKPPEHKERQRALILVIDKSGSMGREDKLRYAKAAAQTVTHSLRDNDLIEVIGFDSQPFVVVPLESFGKAKPYFNDMVDRLKAQGRTYLLPALEQANRSLATSGAAVKHVVVLTDGETGGTADMYYSLVSAMHHDMGATISTIAIGLRANLPLLQSISNYGGGGFYQTDSASNLPQIFLQDFKQHGGETTMVEKEFVPRTTAPNPVLKDLAGRPLTALKGYVATELKPRASLDAYIDRQGRRDPLIASWKYNAGKTLAVTTDASGRWSAPWIERNTFTSVWNRLLSWMTPQTAAEQKVDVALGYQSGRIQVKLTDYGEHPEAASHLVTALVTRPDGSKSETPLNEEVPGELSGSIDAPQSGTYYIEVKSGDTKNKPFPPLAYTVSPSVNAELPRPEPNYGLLEHLASATGGRLNPSTADVELTRPTLERRQSLDRYLILAAMIMLIFEALVRRLTGASR